MPQSTLTSKGQLTVPQEIRTRLGLKEGDRVEFCVEGSLTVMRRARVQENPFRAFQGALDTFPEGLPAMNSWISSLRDDPDDAPE